jgi:uncharacterized protein YegL
MIKLLFSSFLFTVSCGLYAQRNLVANPSFEDNGSYKPITKRNYVYKRLRPVVADWRQATCGSVDYYNSDSSSVKGEPLHLAHSGRGRVGVILDKRRESFIYYGQDTSSYDWEYKEYIQSRLLEPLKAGKSYNVSFWLVLDVRSAFRASSVGAYFSKDSVLGNPGLDQPDSAYGNHVPTASTGIPLFYEPQISTNDVSVMKSTDHWVKVSGRFTAVGGEKYITLGSFGHNHPVGLFPKVGLNTKMFYPSAYYYFDDVSVTQVQDSTQRVKSAPANNFVLVLDVSESMRQNGRMYALKKGVDSLLTFMGPDEKISVITFDASPKILAQNVSSSEKQWLIHKIDSLKPEGGTNVPISIKKSYELMDEAYLPGGNNRVVLVTDAGYSISEHSKEIILKHYEEKNIHFSTVVFNDAHLRELKRTCEKTRGTCATINSKYLGEQLKGEVEIKKPVVIADVARPDCDEYSGSLYEQVYDKIVYNNFPTVQNSNQSMRKARVIGYALGLALYAAIMAAKGH